MINSRNIWERFLSAYINILPFSILLTILSLKLLLFAHINHLSIDSFYPTFGVILISLAVSFLIDTRYLKYTLLLLLNFFYSFIFFSNSLYRKYFDDFISISALLQLHELPAIADDIIALTGIESLFLIDIIILPFLLLRLKFQPQHNLFNKLKIFSLLLLTGLYLNIYSSNLLRISDGFFGAIYDRYDFADTLGIINYQATDAYWFLSRKMQKVPVDQDDVDLITDWRNKNIKRAENDLTNTGNGFNLIIIQVEAMQNFVTGRKYNGKEITPNLNKIAGKGVYFKNIYDQTAAGNSSDATLLVNVSLYPSKKGAVSYLYHNNTFDSLPNVLKENGYTTSTMLAYEKNFWNMATFEKAMGFDSQFFENDYVIEDKIGWGLSDRSFFTQSLAKIKNLPAPFYAYLMTMSSHWPFDYVTREIDDFPLGDLEGKRIGHYIRSMHYVDSAIGEFLDGLYKHNLLSNTIIVIYGDHRARLTDSELKRIGINDMSEIKKIPLIISIPNRKQREERDTIGGLIDLAPTVCNILGIDTSDKFFLGKDLAQGDGGFVVFRDGSFIGSAARPTAQEQLIISDLILEKDMIPIARGGQNYK